MIWPCKDRFEHNWYVGLFGGATCSRCSERLPGFVMCNGKPIPEGQACEHTEAAS